MTIPATLSREPEGSYHRDGTFKLTGQLDSITQIGICQIGLKDIKFSLKNK